MGVVYLKSIRLNDIYFIFKLLKLDSYTFNLGIIKPIILHKHINYWILRFLKIRDRNMFEFIIYLNHQKAGIIGYKVLSKINRSANIWIYLDKNYKRQGIGSLGLEQILIKIQDKNIQIIQTKIRKSNQESLKLFLKYQFKIISRKNADDSWVYLERTVNL